MNSEAISFCVPNRQSEVLQLTNELDLTDQQLTEIYKAQWGIEVTFRMSKQNLERAKLDSRAGLKIVTSVGWHQLKQSLKRCGVALTAI
jgi:hypothetical protein